MELVAFLGADKENWGQISALIKKGEWEKVVIIKNKNVEKPDFDGAETVTINSDKPLVELREEIMQKIKERIDGAFEVALSLASGSGKEHMAVISALLGIPVGIKLVAFTKYGIEFIN